MEIIHNTGSIKTRQEEENRAADLANAVAKVEFLCLLEGVPVEETNPEQEGAYHNGMWSKAMLQMLVARDCLTAAEYEEITGEKY
jgi:hypothetical protein|nr:MAG TPA: hypothetical protein [Caudoviricetes sp.]